MLNLVFFFKIKFYFLVMKNCKGENVSLTRRIEILSSLTRKSSAHIICNLCKLAFGLHKKEKKFILVHINYFSFKNVSHSYMSGKDQYYELLNVLKFEEYILYVKV